MSTIICLNIDWRLVNKLFLAQGSDGSALAPEPRTGFKVSVQHNPKFGKCFL